MSTNLNEPRIGKPVRFEIDFLASHDRESIAEELRRLAAELGKQNVSAIDLDEKGRVGYHMVVSHFGSLRRALEAAGLKPSRYTNATDAELIRLVQDLWVITLRESGRRPRVSEVAKYGIPVCAATVVKRFGSWKKALMAASNAAEGLPFEATKRPASRKQLSMGKRFMVLKRALYRCQICHRAGVELEVDHIVPVSEGGSDRMDNLQAACFECNRGKGKKLQ